MESHKKQEIAHYDNKARTWLSQPSSQKWDTDVHGVCPDRFSSYRFCMAWLARYCAGKTVLDYGCGTGIHSIRLAQMGAKVVGIDLSEGSFTIARERIKRANLNNRISLIKMDCEHLEFPDNSFDFIFDGGTFSSLDLKKALPELARVLKPNGSLIGIETLGHNPFTNLKRKLNHIRKQRTDWAVQHIIKLNDLKDAQLLFDRVEAHFFHLFSIFILPFVSLPGVQRVFEMVDRSDIFLLERLPFLQKYAFKAVFILTKRQYL